MTPAAWGLVTFAIACSVLGIFTVAAAYTADRAAAHYWRAAELAVRGRLDDADAEGAKGDALRRRALRIAPWLRLFNR